MKKVENQTKTQSHLSQNGQWAGYTQDRSKQQSTTGFENQTDTEISTHRKLAATRSLNQQGPLPAKTQK